MSAEVTPGRWQGYPNGWVGCGDEPQFQLVIGENAMIVAAEHNALLDEVERLQLAGECTADDRDHYIERANKAEAERDAALRDVAILRLAAAHAERAEAELRALREGVGALVGECASSDCIHLNDMWGRLRALLSDGPSA